MKITSIKNRNQEQISLKSKKSSGQEFSTNLDMAKREHAEKELKEMLDKINKLGEALKKKPSLDKVKDYKQHVKEYLSFVLKNYYKLSQNYGRYSTQILTRVEVINKKIEELTEEFIKEQKENINLISKIDEISGLLLDLYQ